MDYIPKATREQVAAAAHHRCEYCQTAQDISGAQMHIEHIIPVSRGGRSDERNLCLACAWCNSYKPFEFPILSIELSAIGCELALADVYEGHGTVVR